MFSKLQENLKFQTCFENNFFKKNFLHTWINEEYSDAAHSLSQLANCNIINIFWTQIYNIFGTEVQKI